MSCTLADGQAGLPAAGAEVLLDLLTAWLDGNDAPAGLAVDADLRARALFTLSARGRATAIRH